MQQLAEWLAKNGAFPEVVTSRPSYPEPFVFPGYAAGERDRAYEAGVTVRRWPTRPVRGAGLLGRVVPEVLFMLQLFAARLTGSVRPAKRLVSLCPSALTVVAATLFRSPGGRHVIILHDIQSGLGAVLGGRFVRLIMGVLQSVERWAFDRADHVVVLSEAMAKAVRELGVRTPITILPPQIDCAAIVPLPRPEGPPTLMYSGNLGRKQGLQQILDLAAVLLVDAPEIRVVIRGQGALQEQIAERISRDGLTNVALLPLVPADEIAQSLASADLHLVPQLAEGGDFAVPSKAFAIMAAGRTFVATATADSSIAALAEESGAFAITPPEDAQAFARVVIELIADAPRRQAMAARGRAYVEATADTNVVMCRIEALLDSGEER